MPFLCLRGGFPAPPTFTNKPRPWGTISYLSSPRILAAFKLPVMHETLMNCNHHKTRAGLADRGRNACQRTSVLLPLPWPRINDPAVPLFSGSALSSSCSRFGTSWHRRQTRSRALADEGGARFLGLLSGPAKRSQRPVEYLIRWPGQMCRFNWRQDQVGKFGAEIEPWGGVELGLG